MKNPLMIIAYYCLISTKGFGGVIKFIGGVSWIMFLACYLYVICKMADRKKVIVC